MEKLNSRQWETAVKGLDSLIKAGQFAKARKTVTELDGSQIQDVNIFATWIENLRRLGLYEFALGQISHRVDEARWTMEKAITLGEIGATRSALRLLSFFVPPTEKQALSQYHYHAGNLQSLEHNYIKALFHLQERQKLFSETEYNYFVTDLNILGTEVHLAVTTGHIQALPSLRENLDFYIDTHKVRHPHLALGGFYFRSEIDRAQGRHRQAFENLKYALELYQHKDRETLMFLLLLVELEVHLGLSSERRLTQIKKKVLAQNHVTYWDQWNYIRGLFCAVNGERDKAFAFWNKVRIGQRTNYHATRVARECGAEPTLFRLDSKGVFEVTDKVIRRWRLHSSDLPSIVFSGNDQSQLMSDMPKLMSSFSLAIAKRCEFGGLVAEIWDDVWDQIYTESSRMTLKKALHRWRNSPIAAAAKIDFSKSKLRWRWSEGAKMILKTNPVGEV